MMNPFTALRDTLRHAASYVRPHQQEEYVIFKVISQQKLPVSGFMLPVVCLRHYEVKRSEIENPFIKEKLATLAKGQNPGEEIYDFCKNQKWPLANIGIKNKSTANSELIPAEIYAAIAPNFPIIQINHRTDGQLASPRGSMPNSTLRYPAHMAWDKEGFLVKASYVDKESGSLVSVDDNDETFDKIDYAYNTEHISKYMRAAIDSRKAYSVLYPSEFDLGGQETRESPSPIPFKN